MNMIEEWKPVKGFDNRYEVSSLGRIRSYNNGVWGKRKIPIIRTPTPDKNGYFRLILGAGTFESAKLMAVHRIVADTFVPNPKNLPQVNHKDFNKHNNTPENLEWCTAQENHAHTFLNGRMFSFKKGEGAKCKLNPKKVKQIRNYIEDGMKQKFIADKFGICTRTVRAIKSGEYWAHI